MDVFSLSQVGEVCNLFPFLLRFLKTVAVGGVTRAFIYLRAIVGEAPVWAPSPLSQPGVLRVCLLSWALYNRRGQAVGCPSPAGTLSPEGPTRWRQPLTLPFNAPFPQPCLCSIPLTAEGDKRINADSTHQTTHTSSLRKKNNASEGFRAQRSHGRSKC